MTNEIEGKPVSPELMKGIAEPHVVPVELWGDVDGSYGALPNLQGHVEGYIPKSDAEFLPMEIRMRGISHLCPLAQAINLNH